MRPICRLSIFKSSWLWWSLLHSVYTEHSLKALWQCAEFYIYFFIFTLLVPRYRLSGWYQLNQFASLRHYWSLVLLFLALSFFLMSFPIEQMPPLLMCTSICRENEAKWSTQYVCATFANTVRHIWPNNVQKTFFTCLPTHTQNTTSQQTSFMAKVRLTCLGTASCPRSSVLLSIGDCSCLIHGKW